MTRSISIAIVLGWAMAGCSGSGMDGGSAEPLTSVKQAATSCKSYDGYTAALAEATIDCLGAIGPLDYATDAAGFLAPRFDSCPNEVNLPKNQVPALLRIRRLLSLRIEERRSGAPLAPQCIRDAYMAAAKNLVGSGTTVCPSWHKVFSAPIIRPKNPRMARRLPVPHLNEKQVRVIDVPKLGSGFRFPKQYSFYTVAFDKEPPPEQTCGKPETCARACASLFEGFYVARFGRVIVGDPWLWVDPTDYGPYDLADDPYNRMNGGYYHPMSLAGDVPGEIYGDYARAFLNNSDPEPLVSDVVESSEECTRYTPMTDEHIVGRLVKDTGNGKLPLDMWMSRCEYY